MFDAQTWPNEAWMTRADVVALAELAKGQVVVEFGCGGSTVMLSQVASQLISFDTSATWIELTQRRLREIGKHCETELCVLKYRYSPPEFIPSCGLLFVDGAAEHRRQWVYNAILQNVAPVIAIHDSMTEFTEKDYGFLLKHPFIAKLRSIDFHYNGANIVVIRLRNQPFEHHDADFAGDGTPRLHERYK